MNFDIKDVKSWANRHDVKIGDEGYFSHSIDNLRNSEKEYIKPVKTKLVSLRDNDAMCFQIEHAHDGDDTFEFFLPLDKVKVEKKYRPFKDSYEFYQFISFNPRMTREDFNQNMLLGLALYFTYRERNAPQYTTTAVINRIDFDFINRPSSTFINNRDFKDWFADYEIMNNEGEWQPFGAVENIGE